MSPCWFDGLISGRVERKGREKIQKIRARGRKQSQPRGALGGYWGVGWTTGWQLGALIVESKPDWFFHS